MRVQLCHLNKQHFTQSALLFLPALRTARDGVSENKKAAGMGRDEGGTSLIDK